MYRSLWSFRLVASCALLSALLSNRLEGDELYRDGFTNASLVDGNPFTWDLTKLAGARLDATSGDLHVRSESQDQSPFYCVQRPDINTIDTSIRVQGKVSDDESSLILTARNQVVEDSAQYFGGIGYFPDEGGTIAFMGRREVPGEGNVFLPNTDWPVLPFDIREEDAILQFDVIGDELELRVWRPGEPMPSNPTMAATDTVYSEAGFVRFCTSPGSTFENTGEFRYIVVADESITSAGFLAGDFDDNLVLDVDDIETLAHAIRSDGPVAFDLNLDSIVDNQDLAFWVTEVKKTWFGDANLDGEFNSGDLAQVFQTGEFEDGIAMNSGWADGDWNGDREFNTSDLVVGFQDGGYEQGPRTAVANVPEPSSFLLILVGLVSTTRRFWN